MSIDRGFTYAGTSECPENYYLQYIKYNLWKKGTDRTFDIQLRLYYNFDISALTPWLGITYKGSEFKTVAGLFPIPSAWLIDSLFINSREYYGNVRIFYRCRYPVFKPSMWNYTNEIRN